jgi:hypothetical protein
MPKLSLVIILVLMDAASPAAQAAGFYGSLIVDGALPKAPLQIALFCRGQQVSTATVDTRGSYVISIDRAVSPCEVRVGDAAAPVVLYSNPTRYNFALVHSGGVTRLMQR